MLINRRLDFSDTFPAGFKITIWTASHVEQRQDQLMMKIFFQVSGTMDEEVGLLENNPTVKTQVSELLNDGFSDFELSFGKLFY